LKLTLTTITESMNWIGSPSHHASSATPTGSARSIRQPSPLQRVYSQSTCVPLNQKAWDSLALFYRKNDARLQFLPWVRIQSALLSCSNLLFSLVGIRVRRFWRKNNQKALSMVMKDICTYKSSIFISLTSSWA
jgi:hypothetical protein